MCIYFFLSCQALYPNPSTGAGCQRDQIRTRETKIANRARVLYAPRKAKSRPWPVAAPCARQKVRYQVLEPEPSLKSCGQRCQDKGERGRRSQATVFKVQGYKALSRRGLEHSLWTVGLRIVPFSFALLSLCAFSVQAHPPHHINVDETMTSNISLLGPDLPSELQPHISSVSGYLYLDGPAAVHISS